MVQLIFTQLCSVFFRMNIVIYVKKVKNKINELIGEHLPSKKEYLAGKNILYDV